MIYYRKTLSSSGPKLTAVHHQVKLESNPMDNTLILLEKMRLKNKTVLLSHIFKSIDIRKVSDGFRDFWLDQLLQGRDPREVIRVLKNWSALMLKSDFEEILNNTNGKIFSNNDCFNPEPGEFFSTKVKVVNNSQSDWFNNDQDQAVLSYHWFLENGYKYEGDEIRTSIDLRLPAGKFREIEVNLRAPLYEGSFLLQLTMVKEHFFWFEDYGLITTKKLVVVKNNSTNNQKRGYFSSREVVNKKRVLQAPQYILGSQTHKFQQMHAENFQKIFYSAFLYPKEDQKLNTLDIINLIRSELAGSLNP